MLTEAPCLPPATGPGQPAPTAPPDPSMAARPPSDPALRLLLEDATRRARFFQGPARWLREHAPDDAALLDAYADALARELAPLRDPDTTTAPSHRPGWLAHSAAGHADTRADARAVPAADPAGAQEVRMAVAVVAAAASVVSAVAAVVTAVVAVTNAVSAAPPPPPPPPKPK